MSVTTGSKSRHREKENVAVRCPSCGEMRVVTVRSARRSKHCKPCSYGWRGPRAESDYRGFWLARLTDDEIAQAPAVIAGVVCLREYVERRPQASGLLKE